VDWVVAMSMDTVTRLVLGGGDVDGHGDKVGGDGGLCCQK